MGRMAAARRRAAAAQGEAVIRARASSTYEAASAARRALGWTAPTLGPNDSMLGSLISLRDRSRLATRNDGYARGVVEKLTSNLVGVGVQPLSQAADREFRRELQGLWALWTDESDADGVTDWYGQQELSVRCWIEAGECFLRLRTRRPGDGLRVSMQIQVLEPELCPHTYNAVAPNGNRIRAGIEFSPVGKRVAYYFYAIRPGDLQDWDAGDLRRVDADQVMHLYRVRRAGQIRGEPHLTPALVRLRELDKFDDATVIRQQLAAMFVAFLKHPATDSSSVNPLTGEEPETTEGNRPVLGLQPGIFQELAPGEEVEFSEPPDVISGYADFMRQQFFGVAAATGVPYEVLTGDMSRVNDRTVRVILHEFRRWVRMLQHHNLAFQVCRPVWRAWMDRVFLDGVLPIPTAYMKDPLPWTKVLWMPESWPYLNPVQDVQAQKEAIRAGFTSRSAIASERGDDAEVIDAQIADDNTRADGLGLILDSDPRRVSNAGLTQARPAGSEVPDVEKESAA